MAATSKGRILTSTPSITSRKNKKDFGGPKMASPIKEEEQNDDQEAANIQPIKKTNFKELVLEAVQALGQDRKGVSLQGIIKHIGARENSQDVSLTRVRNQIKKAITTLVENETLVRPKSSNDAKGVTGFFKMGKKVADSKTKAKPSKSDAQLPKKTKDSKDKQAETVPKNNAGTSKEKPAAKKTVAKKPVTEQIPKQPNEKLEKKPIKKLPKSKPDKATEVKKSLFDEFEYDDGEVLAPQKTKPKEVPMSLDLVDGTADEKKASETKSKQNAKSNKEPKLKETTNAKVKQEPAKEPQKEKSKNTKEPEPQKSTAKVPKSGPQSKKNQESKSGLKRKDLSDTELNVTSNLHRPLKTYSSDTELEVSRRVELKGKRAAKVKKADSVVESRNATKLKDASGTVENQTKTRKKR